MNFYKLYHGDCLPFLKTFESKSVNLAIIDPPYNIGIAEWDKIENYLDWLYERLIEIQRVLKNNGTMWFFHNDFVTLTKIQNMIEDKTDFIFKQFIMIDKGIQSIVGRTSDNLRSYPTASEYLIFYTFEDISGLTTVKLDINNFSNLRQYFKDYQEALGLTKKQIIEQIGQKADHCFRWRSSQWAMPTYETYKELSQLTIKNKFIKREYKDLKQENEFTRQDYEFLRQDYEDLRYTFNLQKGVTDVWKINFYKDNITWHPTAKPLELIKRIIKTSTNPDDSVIDPFLGSGTTMEACQQLKRNCVGIEKEKKYIEKIKKRCWGKQFLDSEVSYEFIRI